jgi:peptidyl-prolyl cis-trans isomerase A (cyclophilin A)
MNLLLALLAAVTLLVRTDAGEFVVEVDIDRAPLTAANFLRYVDAGRYDGGQFHRTVTLSNQPDNTVKIEVVQAGRAPGGERWPAIPIERTSVTGLKHLKGTISMARNGPDTAVSDFFICLSDQPSLDFGGARNPDGQGFAAFGRVIRGMEVVERIHRAPNIDAQRLTPPVRIISIARVPSP